MASGIDVGRERWQEVGEILLKNPNPQTWSFYNPCIMLGLCGAGLMDHAAGFLEKLKDFGKK